MNHKFIKITLKNKANLSRISIEKYVKYIKSLKTQVKIRPEVTVTRFAVSSSWFVTLQFSGAQHSIFDLKAIRELHFLRSDGKLLVDLDSKEEQKS